MPKRRLLRREGEPGWFEPFNRFIDYIYDVDDVMQLAEVGIGRIQSFPKMVRDLFPGISDSDAVRKADEEWLEEQDKFAQLAQSEIDLDFPLLHSHALVGVWGALEYLIEDLAVAWL